MILLQSLKSVYSATIDHAKFREIATRVAVFAVPLLCWGTRPDGRGMAVAAVGLLIRSWAAGCLRKDETMAASGPYLLVRHPLYLGSCLLSLGLILTVHNWLVTFVLGGITALQYVHTIRHEEGNLLKRFGQSYTDYSRRVAPLWPTLTALREFFSKRGFVDFSFGQYLKNKEYECLAGAATVFVILYLGSPS